MLVTFFFYGFLKLGRMMFNPFKDEADSFPVWTMLDDTIVSMNEMLTHVEGGCPGNLSDS